MSKTASQPRFTPQEDFFAVGFLAFSTNHARRATARWDGAATPATIGEAELPAEFVAEVRDERYPVQLLLEVRDGGVCCTGIHSLAVPAMLSDGSRILGRRVPLTGSMLKYLPLRVMCREIAEMVAFEWQPARILELLPDADPGRHVGDGEAGDPGFALPFSGRSRVREITARVPINARREAREAFARAYKHVAAGRMTAIEDAIAAEHERRRVAVAETGNSAPLRRKPSKGKSITDAELLTVSEIFRGALADGLAPAKRVAIELGVPYSTANRWIRKARDRGLLTEPPRGGRKEGNA